MKISRILAIVFYAIVVGLVAWSMGYFIWYGQNDYTGADYSLLIAEVLLGLAILVTLGSALTNVINHPKESIKTLIGIVVLGLIGLIAYSVSSGEIIEKYIEFDVTSAHQSKLVDMGLYLMYACTGIAVVAILAAEIGSAFKS
jgi:hypothetical protein